jgi:hypothetical protein
MRRALTALSVVALALALSIPATATAATPSPAKMAGQIRTLQKQVKTLQKQVKTLGKALNTVGLNAEAAFLYDACDSAITADALQGSNPAQFGTTPVTDYSVASNNGSACTDLGRLTGKTIARQPNTPTVNVFQSLLNVFK